MPTYIQLLTLTEDGRKKALDDPGSVLRAQAEASAPGTRVLGLYGVLGDCDFVSIVDAEDNDAIARFSMELGVRAGAHVATMPAIPIGRFTSQREDDPPEEEAAVALSLPKEFQELEDSL